MEKLTLRQFSDVVKALVEAGLSKENKKYNLKITETPNAGENESIRIVMTIKAEKEKEGKGRKSRTVVQEQKVFLFHDIKHERAIPHIYYDAGTRNTSGGSIKTYLK